MRGALQRALLHPQQQVERSQRQIAQPVPEGETIPEIDSREFEASASLVMRVSGAELTGAVSGGSARRPSACCGCFGFGV